MEALPEAPAKERGRPLTMMMPERIDASPERDS